MLTWTVLLMLALQPSHSLYNKHFRKCRLYPHSAEPDAIPEEELLEERVPVYVTSFYTPPQEEPQKALQYKHVDFYYAGYVAAGGSGEVYMVELVGKSQGRVLKRFFKEKPLQFTMENYIMAKLNYSVEWSKYCEVEPCLNGTNEHTIALYPQKESVVLRTMQFDPKDGGLIFLKVVKEVLKTHKAGIIHDDLKLGNVLVNVVGEAGYKFTEVQLIDWNLASFYFPGYDSNLRKGTACFYPPELLLRTTHITPAADIWSLAIVMFTFFTDRKPFPLKCKTDGLKAIASLIGSRTIIELMDKYRLASFEYVSFVNQLRRNPDQFPPIDIRTQVPNSRLPFFTDDLVAALMRMLVADPQERITAEQLLELNYFKQLRKLPPMYKMKHGSSEEHPQKVRKPNKRRKPK